MQHKGIDMILGNVLGAIALGLTVWILTVHRWYWTESNPGNFSGISIPDSRMRKEGCWSLREYQYLPWGRKSILEHSRALYGNARFSVAFASHNFRVPTGFCTGFCGSAYGEVQGSRLSCRAQGTKSNFAMEICGGTHPYPPPRSPVYPRGTYRKLAVAPASPVRATDCLCGYCGRKR